jgi:hypothetical protein
MDRSPVNLFRNSFLYEACLEWVESLAARPEVCLRAIAETASLAWQYHPGRFADGALENWALRLGREQNLPRGAVDGLDWKAARRLKTLHVATELYPIGGHTRILARWAGRDRTASHAVVLTRQARPVPEFFTRAIVDSGGAIGQLPLSQPMMSSAGALRELASRFDRVFLHSHPHDPVPIVAFAVPGGPPVAMFNHAHFSFALGPTVSDLIVNTFESFRRLSEQVRFARRTACLSIVSGLAPVTSDHIDKAKAKAALGLDPSRALVLAMAKESYFRPIAGYDFFRTARTLLERNLAAQLVFVGPDHNCPWVPADLRSQTRCRFAGSVLNPIPYFQAADVCLESFPMPSLGVMLEGVAQGEAFPVPVYGPSASILRVSQRPTLEYHYRPRDEEDYVNYVIAILGRLPWAREYARNARLSAVALDATWEPQLAQLNLDVDRLPHEPAEIPGTSLADSDDCRVLADLDELDLSAQIDAVLPFARGAATHFAAVRKGFSRPRALGRIVRRASKDLARALARPSAALPIAETGPSIPGR